MIVFLEWKNLENKSFVVCKNNKLIDTCIIKIIVNTDFSTVIYLDIKYNSNIYKYIIL